MRTFKNSAVAKVAARKASGLGRISKSHASAALRDLRGGLGLVGGHACCSLRSVVARALCAARLSQRSASAR